jgi:ferrous-iron efflux pump FieF
MIAGALEPKDAARLMKAASYASVGVAAALIAIKAGAYVATDSAAMMASLVDSLLDIVASLINLFALRHALEPADREHRFGHGKAEALAGLGQSAAIAGSSVFLLLESSERLLHPHAVKAGEIGIAVSLIAIALTYGLVLFQRHVAARTGSIVVMADSLHYVGDLLSNGAAALAIVLGVAFGIVHADGIFCGLIGLYILVGSWSIFRKSYDMLMDHELPDAERRRIGEVATSHPEVKSFHDLRTRRAGAQIFIQLHIDLDPAMTLTRAHEISDEVEARLCAAFPGAEVLIHQDPAGLAEARSTLAQG